MRDCIFVECMYLCSLLTSDRVDTIFNVFANENKGQTVLCLVLFCTRVDCWSRLMESDINNSSFVNIPTHRRKRQAGIDIVLNRNAAWPHDLCGIGHMLKYQYQGVAEFFVLHVMLCWLFYLQVKEVLQCSIIEMDEDMKNRIDRKSSWLDTRQEDSGKYKRFFSILKGYFTYSCLNHSHVVANL